MNIRPDAVLTFDDVLLVPKRSAIKSRSDVDTRSRFSCNIELHIPIVSSNMDTITEAPMAIAMAQAGGLGVIHRFMSIERQAAEVARVKRTEGYVVEEPLSVTAESSVSDARQLMERAGIGGLAVVGPDNHLLGLVTTRDVLLNSRAHNVSEVMTPREALLTVGTGIALDEARSQLHERRVEKLPVVDEQGRLHGMITAKDILNWERHPNATKDRKGRLRVAAAIGVRERDMARAQSCVETGADALVVDIAHGHSDLAVDMVRRVKEAFPDTDVVGGNVASAAGVRDLAEAGADAIKVGVGPGSICVTRVVTGFGMPQLSAVAECGAVGHDLDVPIIADGGLRASGDLVKALAAGASTAMFGGVLAGTEESPGAVVMRNGSRQKVVRGMASLSANIERKAIDSHTEVDPTDWERVVPEGVEAAVPYRGSVREIVHQLVGGLRSGLSYCGANDIPTLWEKAEFVRITSAGMSESRSHDVQAF